MKAAKVVACIGLLLTTLVLAVAQLFGIFFADKWHAVTVATLILQQYVYLDALGVEMKNTKDVIETQLKQIKESQKRI